MKSRETPRGAVERNTTSTTHGAKSAATGAKAGLNHSLEFETNADHWQAVLSAGLPQPLLRRPPS